MMHGPEDTSKYKAGVGAGAGADLENLTRIYAKNMKAVGELVLGLRLRWLSEKHVQSISKKAKT